MVPAVASSGWRPGRGVEMYGGVATGDVDPIPSGGGDDGGVERHTLGFIPLG